MAFKRPGFETLISIICGCSLVAEFRLPKPAVWVRFHHPLVIALKGNKNPLKAQADFLMSCKPTPKILLTFPYKRGITCEVLSYMLYITVFIKFALVFFIVCFIYYDSVKFQSFCQINRKYHGTFQNTVII